MINSNKQRILITAAILMSAVILCTAIAEPMPDSAIARLTPKALLINGLPVLYFYLAFLLILRRTLSATLLTVFICLAITLGNNFKFSIVSQPVVASDFIVFGQVLDNPVLFEKYFREQWYLVPLIVMLMVLPFLAMRFERLHVVDKRWTVVSVALGFLLLWQIQTVLLKPHAPLQQIYTSMLPAFDHHDPMTSVERHGLFATLISSAGSSYFELPSVAVADEMLIRDFSGSILTPNHKAEPLPHLVVIQNEAFFDFRVLDAAFPPAAYAFWDRLKHNAQHGMTKVDTYGGATLRTEFALLTGIQASLFGAEMDYPYLTVVTAPFDSIPRYLKQLGYETTAIHPFHATFWRRNQAYQWLGFDSFLSISDFPDSAYDGPYISDNAVCQKIGNLLQDSDRPRFIFAVTMENHGPWSFDRNQTGKLPDFDTASYNLPEHLELQLRRYLYHAQNAAKMASCIIDELAQSKRPGALLFLGDHAPAMPEVFAAFGVDNPWREPALRTVPYLLWKNGAAQARQVDNIVSALPATLLKATGLPLDDFLRMSDHLREYCLQGQSIQRQSGDRAVCPETPAAALMTLTRRRLHPLKNIQQVKY
jgi:phosphoglycerol transferase MdoB-like AlkP superfamily enzyme